MHFDRILVVDWSAANAPTPARPSPDAIWIADTAGGETYHRTRHSATAQLNDAITQALDSGDTLLIGADFPFGYPAGFAKGLLSANATALDIWDWIAQNLHDTATNQSNRFELAAQINAHFPGVGPFWGHPPTQNHSDLPAKGTLRHSHGLPERRTVEQLIPRAQTVWKLYTTGSVGSQALTGIARLNSLRRPGVAVWPFERPAQITLAEIYPALIDDQVKSAQSPGTIKDQLQTRLLARHLMTTQPLDLRAPPIARVEGWILGAPTHT